MIAQGVLATGDQVDAIVDEKRRAAISLNHSATHLLHAALRKVLGEHVAQKGSLVRAETLRFDFSHLEAMTAAEIKEVERLVNQEVRRNHSIETNIMNIDEAKAKGAMALFGEKYDDQVRVLNGRFQLSCVVVSTRATRVILVCLRSSLKVVLLRVFAVLKR